MTYLLHYFGGVPAAERDRIVALVPDYCREVEMPPPPSGCVKVTLRSVSSLNHAPDPSGSVKVTIARSGVGSVLLYPNSVEEERQR